MKQSVVVILLLSVLFSCKQKPQNAGQAVNTTVIDTSAKQDTASLRKLLEKSQKSAAEIDEVLFNEDTLKIVTGITHLYYPFGKHSDIKDIEKSILNSTVKNIHLINFQTQDSTAITQITTPQSVVKFFYDDEQLRQEIVSANIRDSNFHFLNNIRIGMSKNELLKILFNKPPAVTVNTIKLISALDGIKHYYIFKGNRLIEIKMVTDYTFIGK
ncbi:hypothetical protein [Mucilaginibacter aquariorum]|uniref:DUF4292 domain-containing protein n=1 Tax=Mucilaginibacter aquariorum TaxID=2967225 RepID=A0ABT1T2U2_9SPHI|nr:hypothetical protein [Mucilaginibacter aquariorum]MCQ6958837.1 hypothetical protein [Mucilaginibacter aquariorum]